RRQTAHHCDFIQIICSLFHFYSPFSSDIFLSVFMIKEAGRQNNLKIGDFFIAAGHFSKLQNREL
ncbi:MAG: hypothetical protein K5908_01825, partial [Erysipelotrichaceae bacterium]|nr:hypothetical protein [Erysipelotrichaceae bacterium]